MARLECSRRAEQTIAANDLQAEADGQTLAWYADQQPAGNKVQEVRHAAWGMRHVVLPCAGCKLPVARCPLPTVANRSALRPNDDAVRMRLPPAAPAAATMPMIAGH